MQSLRDDRRHRHLFWLLSLGLALTNGVAFADKPKKESVTQPSELMSFENVRVVNAPAAPTVKTQAKPADQGMRAYVNDATGQLMEPTADRAAELDAASAKTRSARTATKSAAADAQAVDQSPATFYGAGIITAVGVEFDVFQVAHKVGNDVVVEEATGKSAAEKAAHANPAANVKAEVSNER